MKNGAWPPAEVVYTEKVDNTVIGAISKRPENEAAVEASKAEKEKDFVTSEAKFLEASQLRPTDETVWLGLANARLNQRKFPEAKTAIDEFLKLSDTHVNGLFALAVYYLNTGKTEEAKQALEKITKVNYKYNGSYYYLSSIYGREKQFEKSLAAVEMYDEVGGRAIQIYDTGIQVAQQLNRKATQLYLQAKKAYLQSDGSNALSLLKQALRADPEYPPAVKFDKQLKEQIEKQKAQQKKK